MRKLLTTPTEELGNAARFCVFQMKLWRHCVRQLILNRADQQAAALSYQTIFGIVPVVIVMLLIFQAIPASSQIGDKIKTMAYQQLHLTAVEIPSPDNPAATVKLTDHLETIFRKFFSEQSRGTATVLSTVFIIWAALALLSIIESTFNSICRVTRGRSFLGRIVNYWAILTLGPMLIALAIYVSTSFAAVREVRLAVAPTVLNYLLGVLGLFLLYQVMPNTRLSWKSTLWGSAVAALVWTGVKAGFGSYVVHFKPYATLYGAMALVPLSVLWIYITWLIVLFGLELTYTTQNLETLEDAERQIASRREDFFIGGDVLAMSIMAMVATAHSRRTGPVPAETICSKLNVPPELAQKMLSRLVSRGLLVRTSEPCDGYVPATEAANIRLSDIAVAVDEAGQNALLTAEATRRVRQETIERLAQHTLAELVE
jgi:YihY family inner membrane protein